MLATMVMSSVRGDSNQDVPDAAQPVARKLRHWQFVHSGCRLSIVSLQRFSDRRIQPGDHVAVRAIPREARHLMAILP